MRSIRSSSAAESRSTFVSFKTSRYLDALSAMVVSDDGIPAADCRVGMVIACLLCVVEYVHGPA